jgi:hypothetical protein
MTTPHVEHRFCEDIGMFAIDRPIFSIRNKAGRVIAKGSCIWKTSACDDCFNLKFMRMYKRDIDARDVRNEQSWERLTGKALATTLDRKSKRQTGRVRFMTRGEAFRDRTDIIRVRGLLTANPDRLFWIPTRAWRSRHLRPLIVAIMREFPNARIQASTDVTTTREEQASLDAEGWSTMFFGDDEAFETLTGEKRHLCAKTWAHKKGACASAETCLEGGCFDKEQTHVHLKQH